MYDMEIFNGYFVSTLRCACAGISLWYKIEELFIPRTAEQSALHFFPIATHVKSRRHQIRSGFFDAQIICNGWRREYQPSLRYVACQGAVPFRVDV